MDFQLADSKAWLLQAVSRFDLVHHHQKILEGRRMLKNIKGLLDSNTDDAPSVHTHLVVYLYPACKVVGTKEPEATWSPFKCGITCMTRIYGVLL